MVNPETNLSASNIIRALIISKNKPKVNMVMGKVRITNIGLTIKFNRLNTMATMIAVVYESTPTPGRIFASITTARALNKIRIISFICLGL